MEMYLYEKDTIIEIAGFQLGHVLSDMEMEICEQYSNYPSTFQLGHVFSDMEIATYVCRDGSRCGVSIGPRLFRHGNFS